MVSDNCVYRATHFEGTPLSGDRTHHIPAHAGTLWDIVARHPTLLIYPISPQLQLTDVITSPFVGESFHRFTVGTLEA